ncbi:hypothetical protein OESDEN_15096 [Oesophagostomum dentatum]|uniref:Uncharacterized protein n=1 Tax=Oesophagostomum dentatum TaxID=61180 RepID=A0A0B1SNW0_OESDE|nr:hypothetical protein OESDEN_15096 [Oesophagostomum dentatum]
MLYHLATLLLCLDLTAAFIMIPNPPRPIPPPGGGVPRPPFPLWPRGWFKSSDDFDCDRACYSTVMDYRNAMYSESQSDSGEEEAKIALRSCKARMLDYENAPEDFCKDLVKDIRYDSDLNDKIRARNKQVLRKNIGEYCGLICYEYIPD